MLPMQSTHARAGACVCFDTSLVLHSSSSSCHIIINSAFTPRYHIIMTVASGIMNMLGIGTQVSSEKSNARQFVPDKELCDTDNILVDMLNSQGHENVCYCVCDPHSTDCPIIFASDGFCSFTGYDFDEIVGRNCRFLQGPETKRDEVALIRDAIEKEEERSVNLLNYRKDGTPFVNEFFISPLHDKEKKTQYVRRKHCMFVGKFSQPRLVANSFFHCSLLEFSAKLPRRERDKCRPMLVGSIRKETTCSNSRK